MGNKKKSFDLFKQLSENLTAPHNREAAEKESNIIQSVKGEQAADNGWKSWKSWSKATKKAENPQQNKVADEHGNHENGEDVTPDASPSVSS